MQYEKNQRAQFVLHDKHSKKRHTIKLQGSIGGAIESSDDLPSCRLRRHDKTKGREFLKIMIHFPAYAVKEVFLFEGTDQNFGKQLDSHSNSTFMSNTLPTKFGFSLDIHKKY